MSRMGIGGDLVRSCWEIALRWIGVVLVLILVLMLRGMSRAWLVTLLKTRYVKMEIKTGGYKCIVKERGDILGIR